MELKKREFIQIELLSWYDKGARILPWRDNPSPYRVWVSEIMLQQTRVDTVKGYFERFMAAAPTVSALAQLPDEQLMKLWEGLGYYSRARNLKKAAVIIMDEYNRVVPGDIELLKKLPGIGPYTSGAVASIAYGVRVPAVDGNVLRVISRLLAAGDDIADPKVKRSIEDQVLELLPDRAVGAFNQALMELGATVCIPNGAPKCQECPVQSVCEGHLQGIAEVLPVKGSKKERRIEHKTIFILQAQDCIAIRKRQSKGLLAGLWELPNEEGWLTKREVMDKLREWGIEDSTIHDGRSGKHIFSHREWHMISYVITIKKMSSNIPFILADQTDIRENYSIPTAFKAFVEFWNQALMNVEASLL